MMVSAVTHVALADADLAVSEPAAINGLIEVGTDDPSNREDSLKFDKAEFLVEVFTDGESSHFIETVRVPLIPDEICYGWRIHLIDPMRVVKFREVFHLPDIPVELGDDYDQLGTTYAAPDGRTLITEEFAAPDDGWISNFWCLVDGDPEGNHTIDVWIDGAFARRFDFEVIRPDFGFR